MLVIVFLVQYQIVICVIHQQQKIFIIVLNVLKAILSHLFLYAVNADKTVNIA